MMSTYLHLFDKGKGALLRGIDLFAVVVVLFCVGTMAQTASDVPDVKALKPALRAMGTVTEFHRTAIGEPDVAVQKFFEDRCLRRWKQRMVALKKVQLVDFFVGAMEITGSYDNASAVSALYNPFWDAILLLELKLPENGGHAVITKYAMLAGETFRGETPGKYPFKTVGSRGPLFIELATVFSKTAEQFDKTFPQKASPSLGEYAISNLEDELKLFGRRSIMRLKFTNDMLTDKEELKIMKSLQLILQHGSRDSFSKAFWDGTSDNHIRSIMDLPEDVREQFVIYSYFKKPNATVFTYIPLFMPRLVATITIPKEEDKSPMLEMYDLNVSKEILEIYERTSGGKAK